LVDDTGAVQEGIPATRKIALPTPATSAAPAAFCVGSVGAAGTRRITRPTRPYESVVDDFAMSEPRTLACIDGEDLGFADSHLGEDIDRSRSRACGRLRSRLTRAAAPPPARAVELAVLADRIDWDAAPQRLQAGDLEGLDGALAGTIRGIAAERFVVQEA